MRIVLQLEKSENSDKNRILQCSRVNLQKNKHFENIFEILIFFQECERSAGCIEFIISIAMDCFLNFETSQPDVKMYLSSFITKSKGVIFE